MSVQAANLIARSAILSTASLVLVMLAASFASAQGGRPFAQPLFDPPNYARFDNCRPVPLAWGDSPFYDFGNCGNGDCGPQCEENGVNGPAALVVHRPNLWYATVDFAPMMYDPNTGVTFARVGPTGPPVLSEGSQEYEFDAGGEFTLGLRFADRWRVEGTYLGSYQWQDTAVATDTTNPNDIGGIGNLSTLLSNFNDPAVAGLDYNSQVTVDTRASLESAEINFRYRVDMPAGPFDVHLLFGGKYLSTGENLDFTSIADSPGPDGAINNVVVDTRNELWGMQLGFATNWMVSPRFFLETDLRGALCMNDASQTTVYTNTDENSAVTVFNTGAAQDRTSFTGDLAIIGNWQVTPYLVFRAGYQASLVTGLALASENVQTNNTLLRNGPGVLVDTGELVYHGPVVGFTIMR